MPLLLTASLFLGPMYLHALRYPSLSLQRSHASSLLHALSSSERALLMTLRNLVFAPLCEEFIFRTCTCSMLAAAGFSTASTLLLSPLLFGLSHLHHLIGLVRAKGFSVRQAAIAVGFQLFHTALFGAFAAYVYLSTGSFLACALSHAFCNLMEFPDLGWMFNVYHAAYSRRLSIAIVFLIGIAVFATALKPAMELDGYHNWLPEVRRMAQQETLGPTARGADLAAAASEDVKAALVGLAEGIGRVSSEALSSTAAQP